MRRCVLWADKFGILWFVATILYDIGRMEKGTSLCAGWGRCATGRTEMRGCRTDTYWRADSAAVGVSWERISDNADLGHLVEATPGDGRETRVDEQREHQTLPVGAVPHRAEPRGPRRVCTAPRRTWTLNENPLLQPETRTEKRNKKERIFNHSVPVTEIKYENI